MGSVVLVGLCRSVGFESVMLIVECVVVVIMEYDGWEIVGDEVDMVVFVELWIGGLASNSLSIETGFVMCVSFWLLAFRSGARRSVSDSPPLNKITSFSMRLLSASLSTWLSMTCGM